jgi:hypothetical protein
LVDEISFGESHRCDIPFSYSGESQVNFGEM